MLVFFQASGLNPFHMGPDKCWTCCRPGAGASQEQGRGDMRRGQGPGYPQHKKRWSAVTRRFTFSSLTLMEGGFFAAKQWNSCSSSPWALSSVPWTLSPVRKDPDNQQGHSEPYLIPYGQPRQKVSLINSLQLLVLEKCTLQLSVLAHG